MVDIFPEEVVIEILASLPVKEIVKCRSVCKSWYSLISSNFFQSYHLNKSTARNRSLVLVRDGIEVNERTEHFSLYLDDDDGDDDNADFPLTLLQELDCSFKAIGRDPDLDIVGCCNGVVCLIDHISNDYNNRAALWNPCCRKLVEIPPPITTTSWCELGEVEPVVGFGYDSLNDDYKLVRVTRHRFTWVQLVEIYSWRCGSWRMVDSNVHSNSAGYSVHVNGVCYWLGSHQNPDNADLIISFAFTHEVFHEIPLPDGLELIERKNLTLANLQKGSLCLLLHEFADMINDEVTIWVMKRDEGWMKLAFLELETSHVVYDVLALKDNGVVLFTAPADSDDEDVDCVVRYDMKNRVEVELMVSNRSRVLWVSTGYIETLVLLECEC